MAHITRLVKRLSAAAFLALFTMMALPVAAQTDSLVWSAWEMLDVATIGDDNTGSAVAVSDAVMTPDGRPALTITPGGSAEETKIAVPVSGADLVDWAVYRELALEVYLPEGNTLNPNRFFLGMADVGGAWTWIAGVFSATDAAPGWNTVVYPLHEAMREAIADHRYMLYFSFFHEAGSKIPLTEPFTLGSILLTSPESAAPQTAGRPTTGTDETYQEEVASLLAMGDTALIEAVSRETFDFFWFEANPDNGLIRDRSTVDSPSSLASVGFGLAALPIGIDRGWIAYDEGYARALTTLQTFLNGGVEGEHGFFYHFVDMETGERVWSSELSSIDTALLVAGALVAGQYFAGTEVQAAADQLYANVDWDWMLGGSDQPKMGWSPEGGFLDAEWDHFDESMILYALAIGSPTHPIPAETWAMWNRRVNSRFGYIFLPGEPLFVYQYPLAFLDLQGKEDAYANYFNNTAMACERNRQFAVDQSVNWLTYEDGVWGLSASDGPTGYKAYGAAVNNHDGTVAPYASASCLPFTPEIALEGMRALLTEYGPRVWREYGLVSAINEERDWYSRDHIGIDQGDILLMLANAQDGFVWDLFMQNPHIQDAVGAMGFVESTGDYAVTPAYLAEVTGK
ncbi:MAG: hypothetical protein IPK19_05405 [Chloroflexi bacterium]|nr:hypothetical protein [Chloroflexota bacterium]